MVSNPNLDYKRYDFRSNIDVNITKSTLLQMNLAAMMVDSRYPGVSAARIWYEAYAASPVAFPIRYPDGRWAGPPANARRQPDGLTPELWIFGYVPPLLCSRCLR